MQTHSIADISMEFSSRMLAKKLHPGTEASGAGRGAWEFLQWQWFALTLLNDFT